MIYRVAFKSKQRGWAKWLLLAVFALIGFVVYNGYALRIDTVAVPAEAVELSPNVQAAQTLSDAVRIKTVSGVDSDPEQFAQWREFLAQRFERVFSELNVERVNGDALLMTWRGSDPTLSPIVLTGHFDVVPVDSTPWTFPAFSGEIADGFIWGRGSMDDKVGVIGPLIAIEELISQGFQPQRSLILAFGHDEEVGGSLGAKSLAAMLAARGVHAEFLLDEGMPITHGVMSGVDAPIAMIGIAEKGYLNLTVSVQTEGGHSSSPPPSTAVGIISRAVTRLEEQQMPSRLDGAVGEMLKTLAPHMGLGRRIVLGNLWLFAPLIKKQFSSVPSTNAMIRTTAAITLFDGGTQANVLPTTASATVNFRMLPGDSVDDVIAYVRKVINDDRVEIQIVGEPTEAASLSSTSASGYRTIEKSIREVFPETLVTPALLIATTDSKYYSSVAQNIYRFRPIHVAKEDIKRFHGVDERIDVENFDDAVRFYVRLVRNATASS